MLTYSSSQEKRDHLKSRSEFQTFPSFPAAMFVPLRGTQRSTAVLRRIVYGMRTLIKGHAGAIKFCSLRNMPQFPAAKKSAKNLHAITSVCGPLQWKA